jgi:hypothetical protein
LGIESAPGRDPVFRRRTLHELEVRLEAIDKSLAQHPLASERVRNAHLIVGQRGDHDEATIARQLAEAGLPSLEELGKIQLEHTGSWWRLHRRRSKMLGKIAKLKR